MRLLTSHQIKSTLQRADERDSRFGDGERVRDVVEKYAKTEDDTVDEEIAHEGGCDDHPAPSSVRWNNHFHFDGLLINI